MSSTAKRLANNLDCIQQRIADAAKISGRDASHVTLVAVTKYVDSRLARMLFEAGCTNLGESRPQQLWRKAAELADCDISWHQIGHVQRNKLARTLPLVSLVHSVDRLQLLPDIEQFAAKAGRRLPVLIEVNISGDEGKHGFQPDDTPAVFDSLPEYPHVKVRGLMGMASLAGDLDQARRDFSALRELQQTLFPDVTDVTQLDELSMGMSRDFEIAIEEGATIVRVGSVLFEGIHADSN